MQAPSSQLPSLNINVGLVGHIDSGKTALAKALSTHASTAAFDKNPQSQQRGITLDLGFSSFEMPLPSHLGSAPYSSVQCTIVDCPGHASLIRTIIGGAQIIDLMILVLDINKGVQTQTAEGLVIGGITAAKLLIVLNKLDQLDADKRDAHVTKLERGLRKVLSTTRFQDAPIVTASAHPSAAAAAAADVSRVISALQQLMFVPHRDTVAPLVLSVDHCFPVRGQGSVLTGTVLAGRVRVGDSVELPELRVEKKVKSLQVFHRPVQEAAAGDRVGVCVTQLDAKLVERALLCAPHYVTPALAVVIRANRVPYYKLPVANNQKFHVSVAHQTVMGTPLFFRSTGATTSSSSSSSSPSSSSSSSEQFSVQSHYLYCAELPADCSDSIFCLLRLESVVWPPPNSLIIASKLDSDITANVCRLAFFGRSLLTFETLDVSSLKRLQVYKQKQREGQIDRVHDEFVAIGRGMFPKESDDLNRYMGMRVELPDSGEVGVIEGAFGKSGKFRVRFAKGGLSEATHKSRRLVLRYKRFVFDDTKHLVQ